MERRTISELIMLHEREPSLRDVYVEGPTDRAFLVGFFRQIGLAEVAVREIDLVDVPSELLSKLRLTSGNRQRVIALALALEQASVSLSSKVFCIADADSEGQAIRVRGALLSYTDVSSMPVYAFRARYIQWYLDVHLLGFPVSGQQVIDVLIPILHRVEIIRRAMLSLEAGVSLVKIEDDCEVVGSDVVFDADRFIARNSDKAGRANLRERIAIEINDQDPFPSQHFQSWVRADDFLDLLHWLIRCYRRHDNSVPRKQLGRALLLGIPISDIQDWPLFRSLIQQLASRRASE